MNDRYKVLLFKCAAMVFYAVSVVVCSTALIFNATEAIFESGYIGVLFVISVVVGLILAITLFELD